jgi:hypothetical protein
VNLRELGRRLSGSGLTLGSADGWRRSSDAI